MSSSPTTVLMTIRLERVDRYKGNALAGMMTSSGNRQVQSWPRSNVCSKSHAMVKYSKSAAKKIDNLLLSATGLIELLHPPVLVPQDGTVHIGAGSSRLVLCEEAAAGGIKA